MVAKEQMNGFAVITEPMMNAVEVAIRAYDPCLSCATHEISLYNKNNQLIDRKRK